MPRINLHRRYPGLLAMAVFRRVDRCLRGVRTTHGHGMRVLSRYSLVGGRGMLSCFINFTIPPHVVFRSKTFLGEPLWCDIACLSTVVTDSEYPDDVPMVYEFSANLINSTLVVWFQTGGDNWY